MDSVHSTGTNGKASYKKMPPATSRRLWSAVCPERTSVCAKPSLTTHPDAAPLGWTSGNVGHRPAPTSCDSSSNLHSPNCLAHPSKDISTNYRSDIRKPNSRVTSGPEEASSLSSPMGTNREMRSACRTQAQNRTEEWRLRQRVQSHTRA